MNLARKNLRATSWSSGWPFADATRALCRVCHAGAVALAMLIACLPTQSQTKDPASVQGTNTATADEADLSAQPETSAVAQTDTNTVTQADTNALANVENNAPPNGETNAPVQVETNALANADTNLLSQTEAKTNLQSGTSGFAQTRSNSLAQTDTSLPARPDYSLFKIISDRNIFNPNRTARSARTTSRPRVRETKVESFSLVGTMSYNEVRLAFFDGTSRDYIKALKPSEAIAGYTIKEVTPDHVKLESKGKQTDLRVGMQMRRQEEGEWQVSATAEPTPSATTSTTSSSTSAELSGTESEILKKLMQKREQELKK